MTTYCTALNIVFNFCLNHTRPSNLFSRSNTQKNHCRLKTNNHLNLSNVNIFKRFIFGFVSGSRCGCINKKKAQRRAADLCAFRRKEIVIHPMAYVDTRAETSRNETNRMETNYNLNVNRYTENELKAIGALLKRSMFFGERSQQPHSAEEFVESGRNFTQ